MDRERSAPVAEVPPAPLLSHCGIRPRDVSEPIGKPILGALTRQRPFPVSPVTLVGQSVQGRDMHLVTIGGQDVFDHPVL